MAKKHSTANHLDPHSRAKAELIRHYVGVYLNILERAPGVREVHILDLLCGEGRYGDGNKGTALQIVETVREHHFANNGSKNRVRVVLNDLGQSDVEPDRTKIERVREACASEVAPLPTHVTVEFLCSDAVHVAIQELRNHPPRPDLRRLFVIDPTGYSQFRIEHVVRLMATPGAEALLFVPVPHMYRFKGSASEGSVLDQLLTLLWPEGPPTGRFASFRDDLIQRIGDLSGPSVYTTSIWITKTRNQEHLLLHFTRSLRGLEKMVDELWRIDPTLGKGFRTGSDQVDLFSVASDFSDDLIRYVLTPAGRSNEEVAVFTFTRQYKGKHASEVLTPLLKNGRIRRVSPDGTKAAGFYFSDGRWERNPIRILPA